MHRTRGPPREFEFMRQAGRIPAAMRRPAVEKTAPGGGERLPTRFESPLKPWETPAARINRASRHCKTAG
jgi:hypothetical protein